MTTKNTINLEPGPIERLPPIRRSSLAELLEAAEVAAERYREAADELHAARRSWESAISLAHGEIVYAGKGLLAAVRAAESARDGGA